MSKRLIQYAALPFREGGVGIEVLLLTSRGTGRWIVPKGWGMKGRKPHAAARREAYEEAGLVGRIAKKPAGSFDCSKVIDGIAHDCTVVVFPMEVEEQLAEWPERAERRTLWVAADVAATMVDDDGLGAIIRDWHTRRRVGGRPVAMIDREDGGITAPATPAA